MNTALIIFAVVGAVLCGPRGGPGGPQGGPGGRHHGPPPPPFLRNVTDEARKEYFGIMHNMNETIAQQKQEIQAWGQKYGVSEQIQEFNANMTKMKAEVQQNVTSLISALPTALQQFLAITDNENQTHIQQFEALGNLSASNPPLYSVLRFAMDQFSPRHGRHPRGKPGLPGFDRFGPNWGFGGPGGMGNRGGMMGGPRGFGGPGGMGNGMGSMGGMGGMEGFGGGFGQGQFGREGGMGNGGMGGAGGFGSGGPGGRGGFGGRGRFGWQGMNGGGPGGNGGMGGHSGQGGQPGNFGGFQGGNEIGVFEDSNE